MKLVDHHDDHNSLSRDGGLHDDMHHDYRDDPLLHGHDTLADQEADKEFDSLMDETADAAGEGTDTGATGEDPITLENKKEHGDL